MIILACCLLLCGPTVAQEVAQEKAKTGDIALAPDVAQAVSALRKDFEAAGAAKAVAEARLGELRARLDAIFSRLCAKQKLDPDEYEWNEDLSGIRKKKAPDWQPILPIPLFKIELAPDGRGVVRKLKQAKAPAKE